jgi:hypothetical protein
MRRFLAILALTAALATLAVAPARADFGFSNIEVTFTDEGGNPDMRAGSHPFAMTTSFEVNRKEDPKKGVLVVDGALKDLDVILPAGFIGNPTAVPRCETIDFLTPVNKHPDCADSAAIGVLTVELMGGKGIIGEETVPVYNLQPSPGVAAKQGFWVGGVAIALDVTVSPAYPYNVVAKLRNTSQTAEVFSGELTLWGNPADPVHDSDRGDCAYENVAGVCEVGLPLKPFLTLPRSCNGPLVTIFKAFSWWSGDPEDPAPPAHFEQSVTTPPGMAECSKLRFKPEFQTLATTDRAESPSGLDLNLDVNDQGLINPEDRAHSDIEKAVVSLPVGMTANPSLAEGLATCSLADLDRETLASEPGEGCPQASKIGTLEAETPVLEGKVLTGSLFIANQEDPTTAQAENPFRTLLALYMVIRDRELGVIVKQPGKIEPDPATGQLKTTLADLPPVPLSHVRVSLREGGRSPLISPPVCGTHTSTAEFTPSGNPSRPLQTSASFQISTGVAGGPCPSGGTPPFSPGFQAGSLNNNAGSHSPFHMRLIRRDGDQDLTRFDATLPPGMIAKLAGVAQCPDEAIAASKAKTGRAELASPSCPASSEIGDVKGGAGVGSQLTYVPGKIYLAGPFRGAPLSVVAIVPAVAGPFDIGTVVVHEALQIDPRSAKVEVDGAHSDPLPHILAGIPLRVRDIRVDVDRPQFTLNPTSCEPFATAAQIWGGGANPFSILDDSPVARAARYQAANCSRLGFRPRLSLALEGGTRRGAHPAFHGLYRPRPGDANVSSAVVRLPRSAFLDQGHIRTICTRVQFAADACPSGAVYGHVTAFTPILEDPLSGPAYLRSSNHDLPDLVFDLKGLVDIEAAAQVDSIKGGIRVSFEDIPDAPISKVVIEMQGGKKGLIVNSRYLCAGASRATVRLAAHNGKRQKLRPPLRAAGCKKSKRSGRHRSG